jgi:hypothetical protein
MNYCINKLYVKHKMELLHKSYIYYLEFLIFKGKTNWISSCFCMVRKWTCMRQNPQPINGYSLTRRNKFLKGTHTYIYILNLVTFFFIENHFYIISVIHKKCLYTENFDIYALVYGLVIQRGSTWLNLKQTNVSFFLCID